MSLFQAREWWSTWAGSEEEFDKGCLCISNIDNSLEGQDKIIIGSFHGVLRIFSPKSSGFKAEDLMVETQLQQPILQVAAGKFVSGTESIHLALLHPRKLSIYSVTSISGSVEHGSYYTIKMAYEHILERTAHSMTYGPFGAVKSKDFICIQSMDGVLSFFEQETFTFSRFLPNTLLPGPITYVATNDSFVTSSSSRFIESYKYQMLAVASDKLTPKSLSGKKVTPDWTANIGEHAIDIKFVTFPGSTPLIVVLGEHSVYCLLENGAVHFMKKFDYNPSCFLPYGMFKNGKLNTLIGSHTSSLMIYQDVTLIWTAQLPHVPVAVELANFQDLKSVMVTLDEYGHVYCSYLGTDPSLFVAPSVDSRELNYEELDKEMKELQKTIKESTSGPAVSSVKKEDLLITAQVASQMDDVSQSEEVEKEDDEILPSITVKIELTCQSSQSIENIQLDITADFPITCNRPLIKIPIIGDRSSSLVFPVSFYSVGGIPSSLTANATATFFTNSDVPRIAQCSFDLPLSLVCRGGPPIKQAEYKLTLDTNKDPVSLSELFPEMVNDTVIPATALGFHYYRGPVVTLLSSKSSNRYRLQCDLFEGLWLILTMHIKRLGEFFVKKKEGSTFRPSFVGPLPLNEYFQLIDVHFEQRQNRLRFKDLLSQRAHQFRVIQRRLLTRFKDKTPAALANLDVLLEGTYRQLLALGEATEDAQKQCIQCGNALSCGTRLVNLLIRLWTGMNDQQYEILQQCLSPVVPQSDDQGWQETTDAAITYLLKTCLAKSSKDQNVIIQPLSMPKDTVKLKKHIALMCERLNKGAKLDLRCFGQGDVTKKPKKPLETLEESQEDMEDTTDGIPNEVTVNRSTSKLDSLPEAGDKKKLPKLKNDLQKRVMIEKNSMEADVLANAAARLTESRTAINGGD
eukprot:gene17473-19220_t